MNVAIVGYGYWGPNLFRNFSKNKNCNIRYVVDSDIKKLDSFHQLFPDVKTSQSYNQILNEKDIDSVVIATPVSSHYELAKMALNSNKHVLIEKPMTNSVSNAKELIELAKNKNKVLMVDHTYLYTGAVQRIKKLIEEDSIGEIQYIDSTRINLGLFQPDVNVLWDLATHDIAICSYLMNEMPISVQAIGKAHTQSELENIAYLTLHYSTNKIAHFNCSWISPVKIRHMLIGGSKKMIVFNDLESTEKVKVYDTRYQEKHESDGGRKFLADYRVGDIYVPKISMREGLANMVEDFSSAVLRGTKPISNYEISLEVVKILEAAQKSIKGHGKKVEL